jgi:radical SAM protein with 4Fe4S-binding SPASM domain
MKRKIKRDPFAYGHLPLYFYLIRAYSRFLAAGKGLDFPLTLQIQTQSFCNGRCSMCPYPTVSKKLDQGTMEWELYQKIANEAASEPLLSVVIYELHNEPLLDKRAFDCVRYFKSIDPNKLCTLVTNGELLDRFNLTDIVQSNLDSLLVSLNAYSKEMYESINTGLDYDRVMKNISYLLANKATRQKLALSFVVTEQNAREVYEATKYWKREGVRTRVIAEIANRAGTLDRYERLRLKTGYRGTPFLSRLWRRLMIGAGHVTGCHLPFYQMCVLFNGDVIICCHDWNRATVVGNARTSSLREIWNSKKMNEIRRLMLRKRYEQLDSCRDCSIVKR